jgi:long-chain acyl-CoA synthetase
MAFTNLIEMLLASAGSNRQKQLYADKRAGRYEALSYEAVLEKTFALADYLGANGVRRGDRVGLLAENRSEWAISDWAIMALGAITVPIYPTLPADQVAYILDDADITHLLLSNGEQLDKLRQNQEVLSSLQMILAMEPLSMPGIENLRSFADLASPGWNEAHKHLTEMATAIKGDDLATIIYTSGTTGKPKGVMLTHANFLANIHGTLANIEILATDHFLSVLPLSHVFERMAGHFLPVYSGASISYAENFTTIVENLGEVKPTVLLCVPRFYEKVYLRVLEAMAAAGGLKESIFNWAVGIGAKVAAQRQKRHPVRGILAIQAKLANALVFKKFHARMGGNIRLFVSGGAPLSPAAADFFVGANFPLVEGYGLTETAPVIAVNKIDHFKVGTVGPLVSNVECRIADDGEILVRGPQVSPGYYQLPQETAAAFSEDGWFATGDIGFIDSDGFLTITDRKKNLLVTSGGKNIAPQPIELALSKHPLIMQALVIGDKRKYLTALILPDRENLPAFAAANGLAEDPQVVIDSAALRAVIGEAIAAVNANLARYESIKYFHIITHEMTVDNGFLTPKMELKRKKVLQTYADAIEKMYGDAPANG